MKTTTTKRTLEVIKADAERKLAEYNLAMKAADFKKADAASVSADEFIKEYSKLARKQAFDVYAMSKAPMLDAVKDLTYTTICIKNGINESDKSPIKVIAEKETYIDLVKLQNYIGKNIGKADNWQYQIENFNFRMTLGVAKDLGVNVKEINDSYAMNSLAKELKNGKTVTSNTQKLNALQEIITAMLGDGYKVTSHDVAFLNNIYCKKGRKALTVVCANHRYMRQYILEIAHKIVCDKEYTVEYKSVKK